MFNKKKDILLAWLPFVIFLFVFIVLFVFGTKYDLKISQKLTANTWPKVSRDYYPKDIFGTAGEIIGVAPTYLLFSFAGVGMYYYFDVLKLKRLQVILKILCVVAVFVGFFLMFRQMIGYLLKHLGEYKILKNGKWVATEAYQNKKYALYITYAFLSVIFSVISMFAGKSLPKKNIKKIAYFVVITGIVAIISTAIVEVLKVLANRPRFRTLHALGREDLYRRWYQFGKARDLTDKNFIVNFEGKLIQIEKDGYKSFPSGHTCAAAMTFSLLLLPDLFKIKNKEAKMFCYEFSIIFTAGIAVSRIIAGAHYLTDVLIGGTIPFVLFLLAKELFITKCKNFKRMVGKYVPKYEEEFIEILQ